MSYVLKILILITNMYDQLTFTSKQNCDKILLLISIRPTYFKLKYYKIYYLFNNIKN